VVVRVVVRIVIDTNVIVAGLRSKRGVSYQLLTALPRSPLEPCVSVALVLEYEAVLKRPGVVPLTHQHIDTFVDSICYMAHHTDIHYLWRPFLADAQDDMVLEVAFNARATIISYNLADFAGSDSLGVLAMTPADMFRTLLSEGWLP